MAGHRTSRSRNTKEKPMDTVNNLPNETGESSVPNYRDESDFDEAFKNLLRPIELVSKINNYESYNLVKELDSYLYYLKGCGENDPVNFVEAACLVGTTMVIYQRRVDHVVDFISKLVGKFRAYRRNQNPSEFENEDDIENMDDNKKKKREKRVKYFPSFEPIKGHIFGTLKQFDCKEINLSKLPSLPKIILNANVKVDSKYSQILPYISIGNGENIGKKYDFLINYPLNRDLAVNEEFDCLTEEESKNSVAQIYQKSTDLPSFDLMDIDQIDDNVDDALPTTPDPVFFDETFKDGSIRVENVFENPNILNVSQMPLLADDGAWNCVLDDKVDTLPNKPIQKKKEKASKKERENTNKVWLPVYVMAELSTQLLRLKSKLPIDPSYLKFIISVQERQKSESVKQRIKQFRDEERKKLQCYDEDIENRLKNGEIPGFEGFDSPDYSSDPEYEDDNQPIIDQEPDIPTDDFHSYKKTMDDMQKHEQNQLEMMNEQLEMRKRVQIWHDNLRPILEEEEKKIEFDIHEYGTHVLNCFDTIGEEKTFAELVGGQDQGEVARFFLSTLMMANTYNLKITKSSDSHLDVGEINIELLKKERHHEELQVNIGNQVNQ